MNRLVLKKTELKLINNFVNESKNSKVIESDYDFKSIVSAVRRIKNSHKLSTVQIDKIDDYSIYIRLENKKMIVDLAIVASDLLSKKEEDFIKSQVA